MERMRKLEQKPHIDADGQEYVPDSEEETNEELVYKPRRYNLIRRNAPSPQYPGSHKLYHELKARPENQALSEARFTIPILNEIELQELARKEYLRRVMDGLVNEPADRELQYAMRPYSLLSRLVNEPQK